MGINGNRKPLIVLMGYGGEHELYLRMKQLWSAWRGMFCDVNIIFIRSSSELVSGEYRYADGEYVFPRGDDAEVEELKGMAPQDAKGYLIQRLILAFERVLLDYPGGFWLYGSTITTVTDFRVLRAYVDSIECSNVFAGPVLNMGIANDISSDIKAGSVFRMISGAGLLISSDIVKTIVDRKNLVPHQMLIDVWWSLVLRDIPRRALMRYDILDIREFNYVSRIEIKQRVHSALDSGHYAFRVKSARWEKDDRYRLPEDVDMLVLSDVMSELMSRDIDVQSTIEKIKLYQNDISDMGNGLLRPFVY